MSDDEMRVKIAEVCGWTNIHSENALLPPGMHGTFNDRVLPLPDYLNDLNAMHSAEQTLKGEQQRWFGFELDKIIEPNGDCEGIDSYGKFELAHATARQRAKAFLAAHAQP